jgi:hypothetical protein
MSTTTLYAELIVVGSGTLISILLLFYSLLGNSSWFGELKAMSSIGNILSLVPVLSVIYLLGIVITGVGYLLFAYPEKRLRQKILEADDKKYEAVRNDLYTSTDGKNLIEPFEFRRSKIRICRGWFINSLLIVAALFTCLRSGKIPLTIVWFLIIMAALIMLGTAVVWRVAIKNELGWLEAYGSKKAEDSNSNQANKFPLP